MAKIYWTGLKLPATGPAIPAGEDGSIGDELAGRYARMSAQTPFMLPHKGPVSPGERDALQLPRPDLPPRSGPFRPRGRDARRATGRGGR
jgi:hypothetical protein